MEGSKIFRALFIILIAITSATIFHFSSENGEISGNTSGKVIKKGILFSAGRTAKLFDVGIDTCGVVFGTILIMIFSKIVYWARNSRKYKKLEKEEDKGYVM